MLRLTSDKFPVCESSLGALLLRTAPRSMLTTALARHSRAVWGHRVRPPLRFAREAVLFRCR